MTMAGNSQIMRTITLLITIFSLSLPAYAKYSGGTGEPNDPYQIATADDLMLLGETPEDYDKHFILTADIDLDPNLPGRKVFEQAVIAPDTDTKTSRLFEGPVFSGDMDGKGHRVSHLTINGLCYLGLFGQLGDTALVENLHIVDVNMRAERHYVGGLAGSSRGSIYACYSTGVFSGCDRIGGLVGHNSGTVTNSSSTSRVLGERYIGGVMGGNSGNVTNCDCNSVVTGDRECVGGLVGVNHGTITSCNSTGTIKGDRRDTGGLVGYSNTGKITLCHSNATVSGTSGVGGLVGAINRFTTISSCYSTGTVSASGSSSGGLVGSNGGSITSCYSTSTVSGRHTVGGLVGYNHGNITLCQSTGLVCISINEDNHNFGGLVGHNNGSIICCYSTGGVSGDRMVGGLVGHNEGGAVTCCYSTGCVMGDSRVGGLVGWNHNGSITTSFWDRETSRRGSSASASGTGLTTAEMQDINTYLNAGWDFVDETENGICDFWQIAIDNYPHFNYQTSGPIMPEGSGTVEDPYLIRSVRELSTVWFKPKAHFRLDASVDLSGIIWSMPVIPWFGGTFDGNGYVINNLHIEGGGYLGLFGRLASESKISNLSLEAVSINGTDYFVGGLVGYCDYDSEITMSFCTGSVRGHGDVGGLAGSNQGTISTSYSTAAITAGGSNAGGLVGSNGNRYGDKGSIKTSYSTGKVTGGSNVGGLAGSNYGVIHMSYSAGTLVGDEWVGGLVGFNNGSTTSSVWDVESSGFMGSDGGVGLTTTEMMNPDMLGLNDFANDPNWVIDGGQSYPHLAWEGTPGDTILEPVIDWLDGRGTAHNPYRIDMADQLILLGKASLLWNKHFVLEDDVDFSSTPTDITVFQQSLIHRFAGFFDGNGYTISNLSIIGGNNLGLFGILDSGAKVTDLGIVDVDIAGLGNNLGGLAGRMEEASVIHCYSTGTVSGVGEASSNVGGLLGSTIGHVSMSYSTTEVFGNGRIGGLVGYCDGSIFACYSNGIVTGEYKVGGLLGCNSNRSVVSNCYSTATVTGDSAIGGLVGWNESWAWDWGGKGTLTMSYSTGRVSGSEWRAGGLVGEHPVGNVVVAASFWDMETSGQATSAGGMGLTTAEMQTASTFLEAGWDFVDETTNGTEDIWWILEGQDYPRLWWEESN